MRRYFRPFSTKVRSGYNTRNQVVSQEARGFEPHPVRHLSPILLINRRFFELSEDVYKTSKLPITGDWRETDKSGENSM